MINNENGRSMVEMLGVLAIIGVLSVAGIAGYSMAMRKYRTNEILNAASQLVMLAQADSVAAGGASRSATSADKLGGNVAGYDLTATCSGSTCSVDTSGDKTATEWTDARAAVASSNYYTLAS